MKIEPWPRGQVVPGQRPFLGSGAGFKRPTLLEITGPLFMSYAVVSNLQYRLSEADGGTLITFRHTVLGFVPGDYKEGMGKGWAWILERTCKHAEGPRSW